MADVPAFGWSIGVLFRAWHESANAALAELPHRARGFQILQTVAASEPPTQAALAAHLGIDRTVLTYVLDDLVAEGVLERLPDQADRRVRRIAMTEAGRTRLIALDAGVRKAEAELLAGLGDEERELLHHLLGAAAAQVHSGDPRHDECTVIADILSADAMPASIEPRQRAAS